MRLRLLACVFSLQGAMIGTAMSAVATPADVVFVDGAVYTVDPARSWASALAVTGDRITYVGSDTGARALVGPHTRLIDLKQRMLLPGFQDSHVHPSEAPNPANALDLHGLLQREQVLERIRQFARAHPAKAWIVGARRRSHRRGDARSTQRTHRAQVHMHAIGDGAVHAGLDAVAAARRANGFRDNRDTLAHLGLIADADVARFRTLGVVANMTPLWSVDDPWETIFAPRLFGPGRFSELYRTRTLLEAGAVLVWGSDWPVTGVSPLEGLETAITHRYPGGRDPKGRQDHAWKAEERVSLEQAIVAYTAAGAWLLHDELSRGSLAVGKAADLVVLGRNLFDTPPLEIHDVPVDMTLVAGEVIFERRKP